MTEEKLKKGTRQEEADRGGILRKKSNLMSIQNLNTQRVIILLVIKIKNPRKFGAGPKPRNRLRKKRKNRNKSKKQRRLLSTSVRKRREKMLRQFPAKLSRLQLV